MKTTKNKLSAGILACAMGIAAVSMTVATNAAHAQAAMEAGNIAQGSGGAVNSQRSRHAASPYRTVASPRTSAAKTQSQGQNMRGPKCTQGLAPPSAPLELKLGKSTLLRMPNPVAYRTVGNPDLVQTMLVAPDALYLLGVNTGATNMIIQDKSGACHVVDVLVQMDTQALEQSLRTLMPAEKDIKVTATANSVILTGVAEDASAVHRAVEIANAFVRQTSSSGNSGDAQQTASQGQVINQLSVRAPQQVMLEVKVAEVSKTLLEKLGVGTQFQGSSGSWTYGVLTEFLTGITGGLIGATKSNGNEVALEAEIRNGLVKILAEPNVMAVSGKTGSFLAGGAILIPVAQSNNNGMTTITLQEKKFGVALEFTPTVLAGGRINLEVEPVVSELSREGIGITAAGITGTSILPLITERRAKTTVQLFDGQSFAIGGLIKNNTTANIRALPGLGEIPVLGTLFRSTDFQQDKSELVFVITPRLVKPLPANYALPTDRVVEPSRAERLLGGRLEGQPSEAAPAASPAASQASQAGLHDRSSGFELR